MADDYTEYKRVSRILREMGYTEVRPAGAEEWVPVGQVDGRYGTTDETHVYLPGPGQSHVTLKDVEGGEPVGWARTPPEEPHE